MTARDPSASLSLAVFFGQSRDWRPSSVEAASRALSREGQDVAATLTDDPLRGDPGCPTVRRLVALLHRPRTLAAAFFAGADLIRPEPVDRDRGPWGGAA